MASDGSGAKSSSLTTFFLQHLTELQFFFLFQSIHLKTHTRSRVSVGLHIFYGWQSKQEANPTIIRFFLQGTASLYISGYPRSHYVDEGGLEPREPPTSASQVLGQEACGTKLSQHYSFNIHGQKVLKEYFRHIIQAHMFSRNGARKPSPNNMSK